MSIVVLIVSTTTHKFLCFCIQHRCKYKYTTHYHNAIYTLLLPFSLTHTCICTHLINVACPPSPRPSIPSSSSTTTMCMGPLLCRAPVIAICEVDPHPNPDGLVDREPPMPADSPPDALNAKGEGAAGEVGLDNEEGAWAAPRPRLADVAVPPPPAAPPAVEVDCRDADRGEYSGEDAVIAAVEVRRTGCLDEEEVEGEEDAAVAAAREGRGDGVATADRGEKATAAPEEAANETVENEEAITLNAGQGSALKPPPPTPPAHAPASAVARQLLVGEGAAAAALHFVRCSALDALSDT